MNLLHMNLLSSRIRLLGKYGSYNWITWVDICSKQGGSFARCHILACSIDGKEFIIEYIENGACIFEQGIESRQVMTKRMLD
jgi:hypothetical protein